MKTLALWAAVVVGSFVVVWLVIDVFVSLTGVAGLWMLRIAAPTLFVVSMASVRRQRRRVNGSL